MRLRAPGPSSLSPRSSPSLLSRTSGSFWLLRELHRPGVVSVPGARPTHPAVFTGLCLVASFSDRSDFPSTCHRHRRSPSAKGPRRRRPPRPGWFLPTWGELPVPRREASCYCSGSSSTQGGGGLSGAAPGRQRVLKEPVPSGIRGPP